MAASETPAAPLTLQVYNADAVSDASQIAYSQAYLARLEIGAKVNKGETKW